MRSMLRKRAAVDAVEAAVVDRSSHDERRVRHDERSRDPFSRRSWVVSELTPATGRHIRATRRFE